MSTFSTFLIGFIILILGLALGAYMLNVKPMWIMVGVIVMIGIGVLSATSQTKMRDPSAGTNTTVEKETVVRRDPPAGR
jgi:MFS superfamily sulfate permease-like transporter